MEFLENALYFIVKLLAVTLFIIVCQASVIFKEQMNYKVCSIFGYSIKLVNLYYFFLAHIGSFLFDQIVPNL